jgi:hypothetical protein
MTTEATTRTSSSLQAMARLWDLSNTLFFSTAKA